MNSSYLFYLMLYLFILLKKNYLFKISFWHKKKKGLPNQWHHLPLSIMKRPDFSNLQESTIFDLCTGQ